MIQKSTARAGLAGPKTGRGRCRQLPTVNTTDCRRNLLQVAKGEHAVGSCKHWLSSRFGRFWEWLRIVCAAQRCIPFVPGIVHETVVAGKGTFDQPRFPSAQTTCTLSPPALAPRGRQRRKGCRRRVAGPPETLRVQSLPRAISCAHDHAERRRRGLV